MAIFVISLRKKFIDNAEKESGCFKRIEKDIRLSSASFFRALFELLPFFSDSLILDHKCDKCAMHVMSMSMHLCMNVSSSLFEYIACSAKISFLMTLA